MSLTTDIAKSWVAPRRVLRGHLAHGPREDRALVFLMMGCALIFLSQIPRIVRASELDGSIATGALIGGALLSWMFFAPLLLYLVAGLSHVLSRAMGGAGSWFGARLALFWALLAAAPIWMISGLAEGYLGTQNPAVKVIGAFAMALFMMIWLLGLFEAERKGQTA